jgi:hypothetical protein
MVSFKTEFYPDGFTEAGSPNGRRVFTLSFKVNDISRYKRMTDKENADALEVIEDFEKKLAIFKSRFGSATLKHPIHKD